LCPDPTWTCVRSVKTKYSESFILVIFFSKSLFSSFEAPNLFFPHQAKVPTLFAPNEARALVEKALGKKIDDVFSFWDDTPRGIASIGEVSIHNNSPHLYLFISNKVE